MSKIFLICSLIVSSFAFAEWHPIQPDLTLTPGELCTKADSYRYPEKIAYCERDVSVDAKSAVIHEYKIKFPQLSLNSKTRKDYKIDHFIPLCMGGANEITNLWPQHKTVFAYTDSLENDLCEELALGEISQREAVDQIKYAKLHVENLKKVGNILNFVSQNYKNSGPAH